MRSFSFNILRPCRCECGVKCPVDAPYKTTCAPGYFCPALSGSMTLCEAGYYCPFKGMYVPCGSLVSNLECNYSDVLICRCSPIACPPGSYTQLKGQSKCILRDDSWQHNPDNCIYHSLCVLASFNVACNFNRVLGTLTLELQPATDRLLEAQMMTSNFLKDQGVTCC